MNRKEIAQLLTIASGFDRRQVDPVTVESWALVPDIQQMTFEDARSAVIAHQTGVRSAEYLTVRHIVDAVRKTNRVPDVESDVRSAKARKLIEPTWPKDAPLPPEVANSLASARDKERIGAQIEAAEIGAVSDFELVLKDDA